MQFILDKQHEIHRPISPSKLVLHGTSLATHDFTRKLATLRCCFILESSNARNSLSKIQDLTDDSCKVILIKNLDTTDRLCSLFSINQPCSSSPIYGQVHDYHIQEACHSNVYHSISSQSNDVKMKERAATIIQSYWKAWHGRKKYLDVKSSLVKIQANFRMNMARQKYLRLLACVVLLQKLFKDSRTCRLLDFQQRRKKAATIIQAHYRGWKVRCMVSGWHDVARRIQMAWRVYQESLISPSDNIYLQHPLEIHSDHEICEDVLANGASSKNEAQSCLPSSDSCSISCTMSTNKIIMACDYQVSQDNTEGEQCICSSPVKKPTGLESHAGLRTMENHVPSVGGLLGVSKRNEKCHVFPSETVKHVPAIAGDISYSCLNTSANMPDIFKDNFNDNRSRIRMKSLSQHEKKLQQFAKVFLLHHQISMVQYRAQFAPPYPPSQNGQIQNHEDFKSKASLTIGSIGNQMSSRDVFKVPELDFVIDIELLTRSQNLTCFTDMQSTLIDTYRTENQMNQQHSASLLENVTSMAFLKAISIRHASFLDLHNILFLLLALVVYTKSVCRSVVGWSRKQ